MLLYTCSLRRKIWNWKQRKWVFLDFYLKGLLFGLLITNDFIFFWLGTYVFYFEVETNSKGCSARMHCLKMKFSIKDFFSKCDQIRKKLQIWSHLLKKSLMENFIFVAVICTVGTCSNCSDATIIKYPEKSFLLGAK